MSEEETNDELVAIMTDFQVYRAGTAPKALGRCDTRSGMVVYAIRINRLIVGTKTKVKKKQREDRRSDACGAQTVPFTEKGIEILHLARVNSLVLE